MKTGKAMPKYIRGLVDAGTIKPMRANKGDKYPTIGFDEKEQRWYAWNAKVWNAFGVGSAVRVGNCAYTEERGAWIAGTVDDAKQMAIDFARGVA